MSLQRAVAAFETGRWELARTAFCLHLRDEPQNPVALSLLAACCQNMGESDRAILHAGECIRYNPDFPHGYYVLSVALGSKGKLKEAEAAIKEALRGESQNAAYFYFLAKLQFDRDLLHDCLRTLDQALEVDAVNVKCLRLKAVTLIRLGRKEESNFVHRHAMSLSPETAQLHADAAWKAMYHGGSFEQAQEYFAEALRLNPQAKSYLIGLKASRLVGPCTFLMCVTFAFLGASFSLKYFTEWGTTAENGSFGDVIILVTLVPFVLSALSMLAALLIGKVFANR